MSVPNRPAGEFPAPAPAPGIHDQGNQPAWGPPRLAIAALVLAIWLPGRTGALDFKPDFGFRDPESPLADFAGRDALARAELIPEAPFFVPGRPFRLLLKLEHRPDAYSYWLNPGGPGLAARLDWRLPAGFSISPPEWPAPDLRRVSGIVTHVLKGKTYLIHWVTPPDNLPPGAEIILAGELNSQFCTKTICLPVKMELTAKVTAASPDAARPAANRDLAAALAGLPIGDADWDWEAGETPDSWLLRFKSLRPDPPELTGAHFFEDGAAGFRIDSQKPQSLEKSPDGWLLRLPRLEKPSIGEPALRGVIRLAGASFGAIKIDLPLPASGPGETDPEGISPAHPDFSALLAFAFLGGLILNVMPCVFPVIGLKIMGFARQAHGNRREICLHGAAYAGGVLLCFWTLGAVVAGLGLGWGAQLQSKWFLFLLCHLFLILSMNMAGAFRIGTPLADGRFAAGGGGIRRSFGAGLLATVISTPCSAPFLGAAIGYALAAPVIWSFAVFTLMGLGFASPYLFLSAFPGLLKILPKPGPWLETFRQAMSFPLFAATAYLAWTLEATLGEWRFLALLIGLVLTALACWLFGRSQIDRPASPRLARLLGAIALPVLVSGLALGLPPRGTGLEWGDWSPEAVRSLRSEGRPVYVDFTARWCATCQINKLVWLDSELASLVAEKRVALLRADWTLPDERIALTLRREFNRAAIPVNVLYPPGEGRGRVLPEILTAGAVIREMAGLP